MNSKHNEGKLEEGHNISHGPNTRSARRSSAVTDLSAGNDSSGSKRKADSNFALGSLPKKIKEDPSIRRSEIYWYEDGNVIIQIEDTHFKLYRGQLSRASTFFARLLQGGDEHSLVSKLHDLLYFHVTEISAADFTLLLEWLNDLTEIFTQTVCPSYREVASILRSSTVLEFPSLRAAASYILENLWQPNIPSVLDGEALPYAADTVILAKECDLPIILKRAYYELLVDLDFEQSRDEGDTATNTFPLPSEDLYRLSYARAKMFGIWAGATTKFPDTWMSCPGRRAHALADNPCPSLLKRKAAWFKFICESGLAQSWIHDPINGFETLQLVEWTAGEICGECVRKMRSQWKEQQADLWTHLDTWLELNVVQQYQP